MLLVRPQTLYMLQHTDGLSVPEPSTQPNLPIPSLYSSYFPYRAQHSILSTVQCVLEECCFDFIKKWMPSVLEEHGWDCAAAAELTMWTKLLAKMSGRLPRHAFRLSGSSLNEVLFATNNVRHTSVHRLPTTSRGIDMLIMSAKKLAETLQDPLRTSQLEDLHFELESQIKAMELNKNVLENTLSHELQVLQHQRKELDRKEKELIEKTIQEDLENKNLIGLLIEESVKRIFDNALKQVNENQGSTEVQADEKQMNGLVTAEDASFGF